MSDEHDPDLRRLFASTAERPGDDAFVAAVTARTARVRRIGPLAWRLGSAAVFTVAATALGLALAQSAKVVTPLLDATPIGMAVSLALALAGVVCFRLLASLASTRF